MPTKYIGDPNHDDYDGGWPLRKERAAVKKGAALLDSILPGWYKKVRLNRLQMHSGSQCMLGQLFGHDVEAQLAEQMYPEEMKCAREYGGRYGYSTATFREFNGDKKTLLERLMIKLGLDKKEKARQQLKALQHVCRGHSNECLWAEEIADRRAKESTNAKIK